MRDGTYFEGFDVSETERLGKETKKAITDRMAKEGVSVADVIDTFYSLSYADIAEVALLRKSRGYLNIYANRTDSYHANNVQFGVLINQLGALSIEQLGQLLNAGAKEYQKKLVLDETKKKEPMELYNPLLDKVKPFIDEGSYTDSAGQPYLYKMSDDIMDTKHFVAAITNGQEFSMSEKNKIYAAIYMPKGKSNEQVDRKSLLDYFTRQQK